MRPKARQAGQWIDSLTKRTLPSASKAFTLWLGPRGAAHLLSLKRNSAPVLRDRFFPGQPIDTTLEHVVLEQGQVRRRSTVATTGAGTEELAGLHYARFHAGEKGMLWVILSVTRRARDGTQRVENQARRILPEPAGATACLDLKEPFLVCFTPTERGGSPPGKRLDLLGNGRDPTVLRSARVQLSVPRGP